MTTAKDTLAMLEDHPLTKTLRAEHAAELLKKREDAGGRLVELRKEADEVLPVLQSTLAEATARLARHDAARRVLQDAVTVSSAALYGERLRVTRETSAAKEILLSTADPQIDAAIQFFRERHEKLLRKSIDSQTRIGEFNVFSMSRKMHVFTNVAAIRNGLQYCLLAIKELDLMKLVPELDAGRIELLKAGIPIPDAFAEAVGSQPYPPAGPESVNPLRCFPSEDETNWRIGKINEKVKKILQK